MSATRTAACACGGLRIHCEGEPLLVSACSCAACRRRTGGAFGIAAFFGEGSVRAEGESRPFSRMGDSGFAVEHSFCPTCGTSVFWRPLRKPGFVGVAWGAFADAGFQAPTQSVNEEGKPDWLTFHLGD